MVAGAYLIFAWNDTVLLQKLLILNFIAVLLHQFEEYSWPGGFPAIANMVLKRSERPDRYWLNQNNSMVANLNFAYVFYLVPVFFPNVIWLGLAPVLGGAIVQFFTHAIYENIKLRSFYNPGVAATVFGHIPIGVIYVYYILANHLVNWWDWLLAVAWLAIFCFLNFYILEQKLLADKNSPYPFDQDEMKRFDIEKKLERARR
ncbi:MAG: HXXEE domain-containing protein [Methanocellales archaeon]|nr:HXXEE domain-containing protein [Methanocellales archaeon]MDD3291589.1 HXXEE domain-containing protein [Methanocellales archaeon]MDD5235158.1 HXXEE domain-containing protein [Methanocellales archaeon]MDD5485372.1 HXXEE domain-containing protein [Methanocellales archaeon]